MDRELLERAIGSAVLRLVSADLTERDVDAIVNAANSRLQHGGGVAGAIVRKGGQVIQEESDAIGFVPVGSAAMTSAGKLKARQVIHAVGPRMGEGDEDNKLKRAITSVLRLASEKGLHSISVPAISAGIFGFPKDRCAKIIVGETAAFLKGAARTSLRLVEFCITDDEAYDLFKKEIELIAWAMSPSPTKHTMDTSIFGLRFKSNESLQPGAADLATFLRSTRLPGRTETHQDELAVFAGSLERVAAYEQGLVHGLVRVDSSERMLLGVLSHTRFFRPALRIAIEEYTYHLHQLLQLDFIKPEKFVRSAEEEVNRLNAKKKDDQQKIARLQALIEQRKRDLEALSKQRHMLTSELCHIAAYVRDNIVKIQQLCEDAIATLRDLKVGGKKTEQLIEDLKAHFKDEVRERRQMGAITTEYLESVKAEVAQLSQRLTQLVLGDVRIVRGIYEGFSEHAKKHAALLTELIGRAERAKKADAGRDNESFAQIERALVALISEFRADVQAPAPGVAGARHEDLLQDKREEMLDHVFALLMEQRKADARTI